MPALFLARFAAILIAASTAAAFAADSALPKVADTIAERVRACTVCHGKEGRATSDGYYPRIAGKPAGYLYNQMANFRDGRRRNATMTYLVSNLPDAYLREIAAYFAAQHPPYPPPQTAAAPPAILERGRQLATRGDAAKNIPACTACHGNALTGVAPAIPGLLGLPRDYLISQFGAWQIGARQAAAPDCMAEITRRLNADDLSAVIAYLAALPVPANAAPAASAAGKLPLDCGSATPQRSAR
ncbi:MAG: c-type cytochrome [Betaproteobacteria bacterium]|nr:c-type cytochrome [Betaproteobacteria bacterium]